MQQETMPHGRNSKTMNFSWGAPLIPSYKPSKADGNKGDSDERTFGMESMECLRASGSESLVSQKHSFAELLVDADCSYRRPKFPHFF